MATYTDNYQLAKPVGSDVARISTLNSNADKIDTIMHATQVSIADAYDQTKTYDVGDVVMYEFFLYKCITAVTSAETFDPTKWERTTAATSGSGGGGGLGDLEDVELTNPTSGESLKYDGSKWVNGNVTAELPDFIEETSGSIVIVNAAERPAKSLKVAINPVQSGSGDPSPDNIRPISGWTGAKLTKMSTGNIWNETWEVGGYSTSNGKKNTAGNRIRSAGFIKVKAGEKYYINSANNVFRIFLYGTNYNYISTLSTLNNEVYEIPNDVYYITFHMGTDYGTTYNNDISINTPYTDTAYHAYTGQDYTIPFTDGTDPIEVYGGTLDVTNGTLTVDMAYDTLDGSEEWVYQNSLFSTSLGSVIARSSTMSRTNNIIIADKFSSGGVVYRDDANNLEIIKTIGNNGQIGIRYDAMNADANAFKTWLASNNVNVCYELATPQTYQLTPTEVQMLLGTNNIWADTGEITELRYIPQTYDDLIKEVSGGGDASYAELTQAEYDALTPAEKENGTIYFITDGQGGGGGGGSSEISYSTEERKIGTWIDGSDLYEKTLVLSSLPSTSGYNTINHGIADVDFIFLENATLVESTGQTHIAPYGQGGSGNIEVTEFGKTSFLVWVGLDRSSWSAYITVRYTKEAS